MKKYTITLLLSLIILSVKAQVIQDSTSEIVIRNSSYIVEGVNIGGLYCNCTSDEYYDQIIYFKLNEVLRGYNLNVGDTIKILIPQVGNGNKEVGSIISPRTGDALRFNLSHCKGGEGCGGQFLILNDKPIKVKDLQGIKLFVLYPSTTCSCYLPKDIINENQEFEITALNWLKFKTKQDWYNYLKQFPDIKIPGEK
jgi:hypothetical protein